MRIHITADRFWTDNSSIERWPEILLRLPEKMESNSKYDIAKIYLSYPTDDKGRLVRSDEFYGLFGAERSKKRLLFQVLTLFQKVKKDIFNR